MALAKYLNRAAPTSPPEARRWADEGLKPIRCRLRRERDGLAFRPAQLVVTLQGAARRIDRVGLWDAELNDWLVEQGVKAPKPADEAERFGFMLRERLVSIEQRYGAGFFNSVLLHDLRADRDLAEDAHVREALDAVSAPKPSRGASAKGCSDRIQSVLTGIGRALAGLKYKESIAERIFCDALVYYLDERFDVTNGRLLRLRA